VRVILDTNVFVSGIFFAGPPYRILEAWRDGKIQLVVSQEILEEYQRVGDTLGEKFPEVNLQPILELIAMNKGKLIKARVRNNGEILFRGKKSINPHQWPALWPVKENPVMVGDFGNMNGRRVIGLP
jgi:putative PIN family toxin of toxin-antitoxin system